MNGVSFLGCSGGGEVLASLQPASSQPPASLQLQSQRPPGGAGGRPGVRSDRRSDSDSYHAGQGRRGLRHRCGRPSRPTAAGHAGHAGCRAGQPVAKLLLYNSISQYFTKSCLADKHMLVIKKELQNRDLDKPRTIFIPLPAPFS